VKDAMVDIITRYDYDTRIVRKMRAECPSEELSPEAARKLVEGAVEYARGLGLPPHPDFQRAKLIFGAIDPAECMQEFKFGKDGKPCFIAGPYDSPQRCRQIMNALERSCGPEGYHFVAPMEGDAEL